MEAIFLHHLGRELAFLKANITGGQESISCFVKTLNSLSQLQSVFLDGKNRAIASKVLDYRENNVWIKIVFLLEAVQ